MNRLRNFNLHHLNLNIYNYKILLVKYYFSLNFVYLDIKNNISEN